MNLLVKVWRTAAIIFCLCMVEQHGLRGAKAQDEPDDFHLGIIEYEVSCLPCHGDEGRGDGPDAKYLAIRPSDLTGLAKANDGTFPTEGVAIVIDGRAIVAAHGPREMPVWGERYRIPIADEEGEWDMEQAARGRVDALIRYVESLQKP